MENKILTDFVVNFSIIGVTDDELNEKLEALESSLNTARIGAFVLSWDGGEHHAVLPQYVFADQAKRTYQRIANEIKKVGGNILPF